MRPIKTAERPPSSPEPARRHKSDGAGNCHICPVDAIQPPAVSRQLQTKIEGRSYSSAYKTKLTSWIGVVRWVSVGVKVRIHATVQPDWVALDVPSRDGVIVSEVVVSEPRLLVKVLARQYYDAPPS